MIQTHITKLSHLTEFKKMYYHVSKQDHGEEFTFTPRIPSSAVISKEGNIPRVCVCPSIYKSLQAIVGSSHVYVFDFLMETEETKDGPMVSPAVYVTDEIPYIPPDVSDFRLTDERWFISPIEMKRIGYIDLESLSIGTIKIVSEINIIPHKNPDADLTMLVIDTGI